LIRVTAARGRRGGGAEGKGESRTRASDRFPEKRDRAIVEGASDETFDPPA
jgi:hypothetical protein